MKNLISIADISIIYTEYCQKAHTIKTYFTPGPTSYFECIVSRNLIFGGQRNHKTGTLSTTRTARQNQFLTQAQGARKLLIRVTGPKTHYTCHSEQESSLLMKLRQGR